MGIWTLRGRLAWFVVVLALPLACGGESSDGGGDPQSGGSGGVLGGIGGTAGIGGTGALGGSAGVSGGSGGSAGVSGGSGGSAGSAGGLTCVFPEGDCDKLASSGCEVNLDTDPANCGACGVACPVAAVCSGGVCVCGCSAGLTLCGSCFCANTQVDPANCGGCGVKCPVGSICANGSCSGVSTACSGPATLPVVGAETVTGTPSWTASSWSVYAAPCGSVANNAYEFTQSTVKVWSPLHVLDSVKNTFKCAVAHAPPYTNELSDGLLAAGFQSSGCFLEKVWQAPSGLIVSTLLVASATAPMGVSFETPTTQAPIIDFSTLSIDADLYRDGVLIDPNFDSSYPKAAYVYDYQPPFDTGSGGYRHLPLNFGENDSLSGGVALTPGNYSFVAKLSDGSNGTSQTVSFVIQP